MVVRRGSTWGEGDVELRFLDFRGYKQDERAKKVTKQSSGGGNSYTPEVYE